MEEKESATPARESVKKDFDPAVRKAIDELVKIFRSPIPPVQKVTEHYFILD